MKFCNQGNLADIETVCENQDNNLTKNVPENQNTPLEDLAEISNLMN